MRIRSRHFWIEKHREKLFLISFIIMLAGLSIAILISKWSRFIGVLLFCVGAGTLYFVNRSGIAVFPAERGFIFPKERDGRIPIISERIVNLYTFNGRYPKLMLITGMVIAAGVIFYNLFFQVNTYIGSNDYVVLLLAASIGSYYYIPKKYCVEREFLLMFLFLLFLIVVIPTTYYSLKYGTTGGSWEDSNPDSPIIHHLLAKPLAFILQNIFDISSSAEGVNIEYIGNSGNRLTISIALGCTGLYSASIFLSAFMSYILVEYRRFDSKVLGLLVLGIVTSYIANLLRMTIILLIGFYYGMDALLKAHANLGELIFMFWIAIFWGLMFRYLDIEVPWDQDEKEKKLGGIIGEEHGEEDWDREESEKGRPEDSLGKGDQVDKGEGVNKVEGEEERKGNGVNKIEEDEERKRGGMDKVEEDEESKGNGDIIDKIEEDEERKREGMDKVEGDEESKGNGEVIDKIE